MAPLQQSAYCGYSTQKLMSDLNKIFFHHNLIQLYCSQVLKLQIDVILIELNLTQAKGNHERTIYIF